MMLRIPGWKKTGEARKITGYGKQRVYKKVEQKKQNFYNK
jgi:hypothetical protein